MKHLVWDRIFSFTLRIVFYALIILIFVGLYQNFGYDYLKSRYDQNSIDLYVQILSLAFILLIIADLLIFLERSIISLFKIKKERDSRFMIIENIGTREILCRECNKHFIKVIIPDEAVAAEGGMVYCNDCAKRLGIIGQHVDEKGYLLFHLELANSQRDSVLSALEDIDFREKEYSKYNIAYIGNFRREKQVLFERLNNIEDKISKLRIALSS